MERSEDWIERFDGLRRLPPELQDDLRKGSMTLSVPAGTQVFAPGQDRKSVV